MNFELLQQMNEIVSNVDQARCNYEKRRNKNYLRNVELFLDGRPGSKVSEGGRGPELRLHVQVADHRQLVGRQNVLFVPLRGRFLHLGLRIDRGHRF